MIISSLLDCYTGAGIAYRRNKDSQKAIQEFKKALVAYKKDEGIYYNVARAYADRNAGNEPEETIRAGLGINPDFPEGKTLREYIKRNIPLTILLAMVRRTPVEFAGVKSAD